MESQDIFIEVDHGPTLIDNNILLSRYGLRLATEGGCVYAGTLLLWPIVFQWNSSPDCMTANKTALRRPDGSFARPVEYVYSIALF